MTWIQTHSGRAFYVASAVPQDVYIGDIAHALANLCRFGGHSRRFYSVAEHSVHVSRVVPNEHALQALLHDATEAYLVDVPKPIKSLLTNYQALEDDLWGVIADHFSVPKELHPAVHEADVSVLLAEKEQLLGPSPMPWYQTSVAAASLGELECLSPREAKYRFLQRYQELTQGGRA